MSWHEYKDTITVQDLVDAGACFDGVTTAVKRYGVIALATDDAALKSPRGDWVGRASRGSGYGYGYGSGYSSGYGSGSGYSSGYGYSFGDGYGDGYGYGDGDGDGDGYGDGDGGEENNAD